jgi:hypothetical protein
VILVDILNDDFSDSNYSLAFNPFYKGLFDFIQL